MNLKRKMSPKEVGFSQRLDTMKGLIGGLMNSKKNVFFLFLGSILCLIFYNNCAPSLKAQMRSASQQMPSATNALPSENGDENSVGLTDPTQDPMAPTDPADLGAALMAVGHMQSSMYSCDGGRTWEGYQSASSSQRCWDNTADNFDCDHDSTSALGVAYGDGDFMATFGWGQPGQVIKTSDGQNWEQVHQGATFAGVSYGNGIYYLNERNSGLVSSDDGATWNPAGPVLSIPYNQRQTFFIRSGGGRFVSLSDSSGVGDIMISKNNGASFEHPTVLPTGCGNGSYAQSNQVVMVMSQQLCVSVDSGDSWLPTTPPSGTRGLLFNGVEFRTYGRGHFLKTPDYMVVWTRTNLMVDGQAAPNLDLKDVTYQPDWGRYSGHTQSWQNWYEDTQFYYSDDGIDWHRVAKENGLAPMAPHPIRAVTSGYLEVCKSLN